MKKLVCFLMFFLSFNSYSMEPFIGEIRVFGFNFCPRGWAKADGQILPIAQNNALFSLFGTTYGGDGRSTFALPDLRGRTMVHNGNGPGLSPNRLGQRGGVERVRLRNNNLPTLIATKGAGASKRLLARGKDNSRDVIRIGNGQPIENRSPYLVTQHCVALQGIYPSRN